ncbi:hypothetical protein CDD82_7750 [Ophiocordyceps australis]|uniref:Uncharacterized protein n=1 Tax=Ophiocordyceps australis TaxID=1399860 RepID=A0A2C5YPK9_9HYPO|nr:hypothetical protein CDD82_7750 [Ophiocordyceps australis]
MPLYANIPPFELFDPARLLSTKPDTYAEVIKYFTYTFPDSFSDEEKDHARAVIAAHIIMGMNVGPDDEKRTEDVLSYLFTVEELIFPNSARDAVDLGAVTVLERRVKLDVEDFMKSLKEWDVVERRELPCVDFGIVEIMPLVGYYRASPRVIAARWSIEMLPIGKDLTINNLEEFTTNRVKVLEKALKLNRKEQYFFREDLTPTFMTLTAISEMFDDAPAVRYHFAKKWIGYLRQPKNKQQEAFSVTMAHVEGYGLSNRNLILKLLDEYPELQDFKPLSRHIKLFKSKMAVFEKVPAADQDFIKVIHGRRFNLFPLYDQGLLINLAVAYAKQHNKAMS